jgi:hypothetical protein
MLRCQSSATNIGNFFDRALIGKNATATGEHFQTHDLIAMPYIGDWKLSQTNVCLFFVFHRPLPQSSTVTLKIQAKLW